MRKIEGEKRFQINTRQNELPLLVSKEGLPIKRSERPVRVLPEYSFFKVQRYKKNGFKIESQRRQYKTSTLILKLLIIFSYSK